MSRLSPAVVFCGVKSVKIGLIWAPTLTFFASAYRRAGHTDGRVLLHYDQTKYQISFGVQDVFSTPRAWRWNWPSPQTARLRAFANNDPKF